MAKFEPGSIAEYIQQLERLYSDSIPIIKEAVYDGAAVVADEIKKNLNSLPVEEARFAKIARRPVAPEGARDGLIAALVDEAVAMLADGTARNEADIDLVSIHGFGFPAALGGLMTYAKEIGGRRIRADLDRFSAP